MVEDGGEQVMEGRLEEDINSQLGNVLRRLKEAGVTASAVVSRDGIILQSDMESGEEEKETFAAMAAAVLGAAETATSELKQGVPRRIIIESGGRMLIEVGAGPMALLVASVSPDVSMETAAREIDRAAAEVRALVKPKR